MDDPIDDEIPFDARHVGVYLSFIQLWTGAVKRLGQVYGARGYDTLGAFTAEIDKLYRDASDIYLRAHTTTKRPVRIEDPRLAIIHIFDPHLNCVPSLHVLVVLCSWMLSKRAVDALGDTSGAHLWLDKQYADAIRIIETILFLKQHSLNCVALSLYYLNKRYGDFFTDAVIDRVIEDIFTFEGQDLDVRHHARSHLSCLYRELREAGRGDVDWKRPILNFIDQRGRRDGVIAEFAPALA